MVWLDRDWKQFDTYAPENPKTPQNHGHHLAYVIYTSGSTGQPKGALNNHAAIYNRLLWMQSAYPLTVNDAILQKTPFSFDVSVWEFFWPLMFGARLVVARPGGHQEPQYLVDIIKQQQITTLHFVPSMLQVFLDTPSIAECHSLKRVICSGEALPFSLMNRFFTQLPTELHNLYGPTEAAVDVSYWPCQPNTSLHTVPIGRPVTNTQLYILDGHLLPVPVGVSGELYIGGIQVGRGYLNRPELTTEKFIPNHFGAGRLYKTGDLARYLPDGNIEFLGRIDHQVKIRGFRIELGEIEAILRHHDAVQEAIVVAQTTEHEQKRLVAYVVLAVGVQNLEPLPELREHLKSKLPDYMVPSFFVVLEQFPLTPNGKIDRKALPAPDNITLSSEFSPPQTPTEQLLATIWAEVLGVAQVGRHDNFFELGGHSLLATQLTTRINQAFSRQFQLRILFEAPTIAQYAAAMSTLSQPITQTFDLNPEINLDPTINGLGLSSQVATVASSKAILLTGVTGFLGIYLLHELLNQTTADIYCLVRAESTSAGRHKIETKLKEFFLYDDRYPARIIPICGDLSRPLLGLTQSQFQQMAQQIDTIYHNGALVNHLYPYALLKAANVSGTQEILRLATQVKLKPVHYISTFGVLYTTATDHHQPLNEQTMLDNGNLLMGGYNQSKWVAEKILAIASDRNIPVTIYRPGIIGGHSQTGVWNVKDFRYLMIKACLKLAKWPDLETIWNIAPVDYVSQAIVHLSQQSQSVGQRFHVVSPHELSIHQVFNHAVALGYSVRPVPYEEWQATLREIATVSQDETLRYILPFFADNTASEMTPQIDSQWTINKLSQSSIVCPPIAGEILDNCFAYLVKNSHL